MSFHTSLKRELFLLAGLTALLAGVLAIGAGAQTRGSSRDDAGIGAWDDDSFGPGPWGGPMMHAGRGRLLGARERLFDTMERLDLSEAQKTRLREIRRHAPSVLMPKRQAVVEARMDLRDLMDRDRVDASEARSAHERLLRARNDLQSALFDLRLQAREVLTRDQLQKLHDELRRGPGRRDTPQRGNGD